MLARTDAAGGLDDGLDLVIVSSPLQYMNAIEHRFAAGAPSDLVLIGDRHGNQEAIDRLMSRRSGWREVHRHGRRPRPSKLTPLFVRDLLDAGHRASLERLAEKLAGRRYRRVAIGDYRNVSQRMLAANVAAREFVLLDDGSVTPQSAAFRADRGRAPEPRQFNLTWFRTALARKVFGENLPPEPPSVTFFTIYGPLLKDRLAPADRLTVNGYDTWREASAERPRGTAVWMLGSDHAEAGICTPESYRSLVLGAARSLRAAGHGPLHYRPHRGENRDKAAALAQECGMSLGASSVPVELDYLDAGERPALVAAFASSAVDTLAILDPELDIARIALPEGYLRKRVEHIKAVVSAHDAFNSRLRVIEPSPADGA